MKTWKKLVFWTKMVWKRIYFSKIVINIFGALVFCSVLCQELWQQYLKQWLTDSVREIFDLIKNEIKESVSFFLTFSLLLAYVISLCWSEELILDAIGRPELVGPFSIITIVIIAVLDHFFPYRINKPERKEGWLTKAGRLVYVIVIVPATFLLISFLFSSICYLVQLG